MNESVVLESINVRKTFIQGGRSIEVLTGLNLTLMNKDRVAIVGRSGCGKSTLLHVLAGLDEADSGLINVIGSDLTKASSDQRAQLRLRGMGFVYQAHHLLPEFSAVENVAMPLRLQGSSAAESARVAGDLLIEIGLAERLDHFPDQMSGGERQRVAVARAVSANPSILLADEPTGNLDFDSAVQVMTMLTDLARSKSIALLVVTHDQAMLSRFDRVYELANGTLSEKRVER